MEALNRGFSDGFLTSWIQGFSATDEVIKSFVCKNKNIED
jgi:hypothetical protein